MENYVVIKNLPDADIGTEVIWSESDNAFYYKKTGFPCLHDKNYLNVNQVTQTPEFFCEINVYPEYYGYNNPVFSRKEIIDLLEQINVSSHSNIQMRFMDRLRELAKINAERIINQKKKNEKGG